MNINGQKSLIEKSVWSLMVPFPSLSCAQLQSLGQRVMTLESSNMMREALML